MQIMTVNAECRRFVVEVYSVEDKDLLEIDHYLCERFLDLRNLQSSTIPVPRNLRHKAPLDFDAGSRQVIDQLYDGIDARRLFGRYEYLRPDFRGIWKCVVRTTGKAGGWISGPLKATGASRSTVLGRG